MCASTVIGHLLRGWASVLALSAAALLVIVPLLIRASCRTAGRMVPSRRRRLWTSLTAAPAFAAGLVLSLSVHKLLGLAPTGGLTQAVIWLFGLAAAVVLARMLMRRAMPSCATGIGADLWAPAAVAVLAIAGAFVAVGRLDYLTRQYLCSEVAMRDLSASLEKNRAVSGSYPERISPLADNPAADAYYLPLPVDADDGLVRAWRVVDDPLGTAVVVLRCSGKVTWLSVSELSAELQKSAAAAFERPHTAPPPAPPAESPKRPLEPPTQPAATMPVTTAPADAPSTQPTQPVR